MRHIHHSILLLICLTVLFASGCKKQTIQSTEVKFINPKGVCNLLSNLGLNQGDFRLSKGEAYSNHYSCNAYKKKEMTCSPSGLACNEIEYFADGSNKGVTELKLRYRNFAGSTKNVENEKDIQVFMDAANILTKATLETSLDDLAKKQILETLTISPPTDVKAGKIIYEKKFDNGVISIFRSVNPTGLARVVELTIYADEYWKDNKNTFEEWGQK